jgi:hypothetical protein
VLLEPLRQAGAVIMKWSKQSLAFLVSGSLVLANYSMAQAASQTASAESAQTAQPSPEELDQIVAPIALYPDALVAQILAASSYPTEIVEADRWMQQHPGQAKEGLARAVDQQSWDASVKALTQFPSILANMDKNLSWTSALGDAYENEPQSVLDAVQVMRRRAQQAGNLKSTPQETVTTQGQTVVIQPASPEIVYVPEYDPWLVYGAPLGVYPGWAPVPGLFVAGPAISFGVGFGIGLFAGFGWGWHHWGADWHGRNAVFNHNPYISHGQTFVSHNTFSRGHADFAHAGGFHGGAAHGQLGVHSGAFGGFNHGAVARSNSARGGASFHGGAHFAARSFHGGGGHR